MRNIIAAFVLLLGSGFVHAVVKIEHWVAPSGARVYFVESRVVPILDVQVDFGGGSAFDPPEKIGLALLTQSLLDAGVAGMDEEQIASKLADTAARLGGSTDLDRASVALRTLSSKAEREAALELMRAVLQQPTFPAAVLEREKARLIARIRESDTQPGQIAAKRFTAALYPDHPYGYIATAETVGRIVRADLEDFYGNYYGARRASVAIIGDVSRGEAEEIAQRLTAGLPQTGSPAKVPDVSLPAGSVVRVAHPASQSHIHVGTPALKRGDADFFPMVVGNYVLGGGGFVSRLMKEVREKRGFAYNVYSYFQPRKELGPFEIGLQTKREQADSALQVVETTLDQFMKNGPTEDELKAAKKNIIDGFALRLDSNREILEHLAVIGFYGLPLDYLDEYPKKIAQVSAQQIRDVFKRRVDRERMVTVIVASDTK